MENEEKNKKYLTVGFIGFFLILVVALVTIFRSNLSPEENLTQNNSLDSKEEVFQQIEEKFIEAKDLMQKIIQKEGLVILDIRSVEEYKKEHLADSVNIPFINLEESVSSLSKDKAYILVDDDYAESSLLAIQMLSENEIANVFYLQGGFSSWKAQYYPTISSGDPNSFVDQSKVKYIKSDKLKELMAQDSQLVIIYLGNAEAFQAGHIQGARNIFLDDLEKAKAKIPLGRKVILYDNNGLWAFMGAVRLYDMGFFNILAMSDGLDGWKNNKFELVK
ncbi:rhodanese-like domain-containing protein [Patescibacteria group bacterium]|nr:rhodanese-like domain-containing protein [Patescibacteria group bacterium]